MHRPTNIGQIQGRLQANLVKLNPYLANAAQTRSNSGQNWRAGALPSPNLLVGKTYPTSNDNIIHCLINNDSK